MSCSEHRRENRTVEDGKPLRLPVLAVNIHGAAANPMPGHVRFDCA